MTPNELDRLEDEPKRKRQTANKLQPECQDLPFRTEWFELLKMTLFLC